MSPHEPPFDLVAVEVALHRAGRIARRHAAEMRRTRFVRRFDSFLDVFTRARIAVRDTLRAWRTGAVRSSRDPDMVGAEVALHRAARAAHRRAAAMPARRAAARVDADLDEQVRARVLARFARDRTGAATSTRASSLLRAERDDRVEF